MSHAVVMVSVPGEVAEGDLQAAVEEQMAPFDENDECFKRGSRWDWWTVGGRWSGYFDGRDKVRVGDLNPEVLQRVRLEKLTANWEKAQKDRADVRGLVYGIQNGETFEEYVARRNPHWFPASYAFLRDRHWHEGERMGWFGMSTATECEIKKPGQKYLRCRTGVGKDAAVVTWNEERDAEKDVWAAKFWERFIKPLAAGEWLVAVDYHV